MASSFAGDTFAAGLPVPSGRLCLCGVLIAFESLPIDDF